MQNNQLSITPVMNFPEMNFPDMSFPDMDFNIEYSAQEHIDSVEDPQQNIIETYK